MMESVIKTIGTLCIIAFTLGVMTNLIPTAKTEKAIKTVFTIYLLFFVISLFTDTNFDIIADNITDNTDITIQSEDYILDKAKSNIEENIKEILQQKNIAYKDVRLHINKQTDNISVGSIEISGTDINQHSIIYNLLSDIAEKENIILGE